MRAPLNRAASRRARAWMAGLLAGLLWAAAQPLGATEVSQEYQIKAAFLYNFTKFVEWPPESFADADSPIVIGTFCSAAFAESLTRIVEGRRVNGRSLVVNTLETTRAARSTHLVFVCAAADERVVAIVGALAASPVLTVGESAAFRAAGGIISFVLDDDKVRFEIDIAAADRARLKLSSQLLKLATTVRSAR